MTTLLGLDLARLRRTSSSIRMRIAHPVLVTAVSIALAFDTFFFVFYGHHDPANIAVFVACAFTCAMIPWFPRIAGCSIVVFYMLLIPMPYQVGESMLAGFIVGFAVIFAYMNVGIALALLCASIAMLSLTSSVNVTVTMTATFTTSALAGYASKRQMEMAKEREALAEAKRESDTMLRNMEVASRLHDTVTNDLSYIIMVASTRALSTQDATEQQTLSDIIDRSQDAFAKAHEIIEVLSGVGRKQVASSQAVELRRELEAIANAEQMRLGQLGLTGTTTFSGIDTPVRVEQRNLEEIRGLFTEAFTNLRKHCTPPADYTIIADIHSDALTLTTMNSLNPSTHSSVPSPATGRGLVMHREIIESLGGTLKFANDQDTWTLHAEIPYTTP